MVEIYSGVDRARQAGPIRASALCLTGGGVLGRFTLEILSILEREREGVIGTQMRGENKLSELRFGFDILAGTSVGALIAAGLAVGISPGTISEKIEEFGPRIFPEKSALSRLSHIKTAWFQSKYLVEAVEKTLGDKIDNLLGDLDVHLAIPTLNETTGEPIVYTTLEEQHLDVPLKDIVLASAAAPIYLPAWTINDHRYVDGGLFANAPDLSTIRLLQKHAPHLKLENISILSIGTTNAEKTSPIAAKENGNWGLKRWFASPVPARLIKIILAAQTAHNIGLIKTLPLDNFERIDVDLEPDDSAILALDNASEAALNRLAELATEHFESMTDDRIARIRNMVTKSVDHTIWQPK